MVLPEISWEGMILGQLIQSVAIWIAAAAVCYRVWGQHAIVVLSVRDACEVARAERKRSVTFIFFCLHRLSRHKTEEKAVVSPSRWLLSFEVPYRTSYLSFAARALSIDHHRLRKDRS